MARAPDIAAVTSRDAVAFFGDLPFAWDTVYLNGEPLPGLCAISGSAWEQRVQEKKIPGTKGSRITYLADESAKFEIVVRMWTADQLEAYRKLIPLLKPKVPPQEKRLVARREAAKTLPKGFSGGGLGTGRVSTGVQTILGGGALTAAGDNTFADLSASAAKQQVTRMVEVLVQPLPLPVTIDHPALRIFGIHEVHLMSVTLPKPSGANDIYESTIHCLEKILKDKTAVQKPSGTAANQSADIRQLRVAQFSAPSKDNTGP